MAAGRNKGPFWPHPDSTHTAIKAAHAPWATEGENRRPRMDCFNFMMAL